MTETVRKLVELVIEGVSEELGYRRLHQVTTEMNLFGGPDGIDSLSLVRIIVEIEREVEERLGKHIILADERSMSMRSSPFRTVGSLTELVKERLAE